MKIGDIFAGGVISNKNSKFNRIFNSLKWRQKYQNSDVYEIELDSGECFKVQQVLNGEMKGLGTGTLVWPAAHVMVKYLEKRFGCRGLMSKSICDIGTGTGITGFAASTLGASVTLTDQKHLLEFLQANKDLAFSTLSANSNSVTIAEYEWSDVDQMNALKSRAYDYILVSDCVLPKLYPIDILLNAVSGVMAPHSVAIFSYEHRPFPLFDPREEFERLAHSHGLSVRVVPLSEHHEVYCAEDIEIWEVTWTKTATTSGETEVTKGTEEKSERSCSVEVLSWGQQREVNFRLAGRPHSLMQECGGVIGAVIWPAAVIVSRFLLKTPLSELRALLKFKNVDHINDVGSYGSTIEGTPPLAVDIGAGCGLTSLSLHYSGYEVVATDKAALLDLLSHNVSSCSLTGPVIAVKELDWYAAHQQQPNTELVDRPIDLIVCSDCVYSSDSVLRLIDVLTRLASPQTVIVLGNEMRTAFDEFTYLAGQNEVYAITFKEIPLIEPDLELFRGPLTGRVASPPLRLCLMSCSRK